MRRDLVDLLLLAGFAASGVSAYCQEREPEVPAPLLEARLLATMKVAGGGEDRAEICAFHPPGARLFVANTADGRVEVLDLSKPSEPRSLPPLDLALHAGDFQAGSPNSVALRGDWLAVAIQAVDPQAPGVVQFWNARNGEFLSQVPTGALPDMVVFDAAGRRCVVANEGEPSDDYSVDPPGSITVVTIPPEGPGAIEPEHVRSIGFESLDRRAGELRARGIRLTGPGASVAQDLEPEFIALSPDGSRAWVSCQENNALAVLDLERGRVLELLPLGTKAWDSPDLVHEGELRWLDWPERPILGEASSAQTIRLGGFSGLTLVGTGASPGTYRFATVFDRGPDLGKTDLDAGRARILALPDLQPRLVRFDLQPETGAVSFVDELLLTGLDGEPLGARPNLLASEPGLAFHDELIVDPEHGLLELDPFGVDLEGVVLARDGTFWMADEYRPSLLHFDARGRLLKRFVPEGSNQYGVRVGTEALPRVYASRRFNRGFEAVAFDPLAGRVYAWLQSPLDHPDTTDDSCSKSSRVVRVLEFDPATETTSAEYVYVLDGGSSDKLAAATWSGRVGEFFVLERNASRGKRSIKNVYRVRLDGATNLTRSPKVEQALDRPGRTLEATPAGELSEPPHRVVPLSKTLFVNLVEAGYRGLAKPEGMARLPDGRLLLVNDDDFALEPEGDAARLALLRPLPAGLDVDDTDGEVLLAPWPVRSLYQPDAILAFEHEGETFLVTANEGEVRDYDGSPGFADCSRAGELSADREEPDAGLPEGREDLDGLERLVVERRAADEPAGTPLISFGARSFSIWSAEGQQVFDSGAGLARQALRAGRGAALDAGADEYGIEPESLVLGELDGRRVLFVGLEGAGGVAIYHLDQPHAPTFALYVQTPGHSDPEGLCFVPAADSPSGTPLLVTCHAESGTVTIHELRP